MAYAFSQGDGASRTPDTAPGGRAALSLAGCAALVFGLLAYAGPIGLAFGAALELWPVGGIVGALFEYEVKKDDSVVALSARYAVSERAIIHDNALKRPYPVSTGDRLYLHNRHLVPAPLTDGIVINLPQRMLFVFRENRLVGAYAVAIGTPDWRTPTGDYRIRVLEKDKAWIVPPSIQDEMREQGKPVLTRVEPGPDNPLGRFWIGLSLPGYGIHGTNAPSSVYRVRTHGCIRVHPGDIEALYGQLALHMPVKIIYAPTLMSRLSDGRIVVEVNPDVYHRGDDPLRELRQMADAQGIAERVDWSVAARIAKDRMGQAFEVGLAAPTPVSQVMMSSPRGRRG